MEKNYVIPILITVPATSYREAEKAAEEIAEELSRDAGMGVEVAYDFEHDNDGQRVLYLHGEDEPEDV